MPWGCAPPEEWALPPSSSASEPAGTETAGTRPSVEDQGRGHGRRRWPLVLAGIASFLLVAVGVALALTVSPEDSTYPDGLEWTEYRTDGLVPRQWSVGMPEDLPEGEHPALVSLHPLGGNRSGWAAETDLAGA
ncbi:MAG: hypothetical protein ACR2OH_11230, partial [Microthrixaceae bacterium]